jgi:hypothetical protein
MRKIQLLGFDGKETALLNMSYNNVKSYMFLEKSTAGWWLISQTNRAVPGTLMPHPDSILIVSEI